MTTYIDNQLIRKVMSQKDHEILQGLSSFRFGWPSLFEYLDLGNVLQTFPVFHQSKLFDFLIHTLSLKQEKELIIHLYDQLFVECLVQVKGLSQIDSKFLVSQIQQKKNDAPLVFIEAADYYKNALFENGSNTIHDLTLYLAWDRCCVYLAQVFEYNQATGFFINNLQILKECLIESFQHISAKGRTTPSFFRLVEALYALKMRDEHLQTYTDAEWRILSQGALALKPRDEFCDLFFVDFALGQNVGASKMLTASFREKIEAALALTRFMINHLQEESYNWKHTFCKLFVLQSYLQFQIIGWAQESDCV